MTPSGTNWNQIDTVDENQSHKSQENFISSSNRNSSKFQTLPFFRSGHFTENPSKTEWELLSLILKLRMILKNILAPKLSMRIPRLPAGKVPFRA
ncbi:hypothetical protein BES34_015430 [Leptospira inadai serovar Lyme]|uniref:Uncharacterized protein n=1 Tax=Leptospira inadai serovar Lyme TaxID=293084 RepID=A0ABX4YG82_9LEPT|nr:hypothetical protein BES34_015430 [Leptospira inadai serovar Lyme]